MDQKDDDRFVEGVKRIKQLIQDKNLNQMDLIDALGVSKKTVSQWLQNSTSPNTQNLIDLVKLLGVTERWNNSESKSNSPNSKPDAAAQGVALSQATVDQLINEIKARYADLNLKADIKIHVEVIEGSFVSKD